MNVEIGAEAALFPEKWAFPCSALSKLSLAGNILIIPGQEKLG
jgi:hypothetical protein